jgi:hypothetical protein
MGDESDNFLRLIQLKTLFLRRTTLKALKSTIRDRPLGKQRSCQGLPRHYFLYFFYFLTNYLHNKSRTSSTRVRVLLYTLSKFNYDIRVMRLNTRKSQSLMNTLKKVASIALCSGVMPAQSIILIEACGIRRSWSSYKALIQQMHSQEANKDRHRKLNRGAGPIALL